MYNSKYLDKKLFFLNPLFIYLKWLLTKVSYQSKYWGKHLRIGYLAHVDQCVFSEYNNVGANSDVYNCNIGKFSYCGDNCLILHADIGSFCSIGPNVMIAPGRHPTSTFVSTFPALFARFQHINYDFNAKSSFESHQRVLIGSDVWIGANVLVVDGVKIGDGAVVGANSVVTKDVEPFHVVGGVPAKFIKKRFTDEQIDVLMKSKWWAKDNEWIKNNIHLFESIDQFISVINNV
ncbi:acetyltransferase-like isoleucine patch superfamily enzyme [Mucilaginibacter gracilis]|uniref:Acetyltransferase-like isoleucine patch superfamily enzyme n=1 Tax=Mucilaginibacter gracilis TaxID=423350 RepID=A0A495IZ11_9SPHI|nr:CatB-related O-acetyltransferase [Mucilaginibacter gracilis]RKR81079.1 acetyltransferase-like isoleucine patch superfamily enzyme [Mucilaginibacter gracilis]